MIIYKATNLINNKIYIGQTKYSADYRLNKHLSEANYEKTHNNRAITYFHNAILKYGINNFKIEVIDTANTLEELNKKEIYWIKYYNSTDKDIGYNLMDGGKSGQKSLETRQKIGLKKKEDWLDPEKAEKMIAGLNKGREKWQKICENNKAVLICPYCKKEFKVIPSEISKRIYCSLSCSAKANTDKRVNAAKKQITKQTKKKHELFKKEIEEWCNEHIQLILQCPMNKISSNLSDLVIIANKYGFKDWRVISQIICGSQSRKDLLKYLKEKYENVC